MKLLTTHTDVETLALYLMGKMSGELSPKLAAKLRRLEVCADLIRQYGSRLKVVPMMVHLYGEKKLKKLKESDQEILDSYEPKREGGYSERTAYGDFNEAQELFATTTQTDKRPFWVDLIFGEIMKTKRMAEKAGMDGGADARAMAKCDQNLIDAGVKLLGNGEQIDWKKVQPMVPVFVFAPEMVDPDGLIPTDPKELDKLRQRLIKKKADRRLIEDIDFEEIPQKALAR